MDDVLGNMREKTSAFPKYISSGPDLLAKPSIEPLNPLVAGDTAFTPLDTVRIVFVLDGKKARVVLAIQRLLPVRHEVTAL